MFSVHFSHCFSPTQRQTVCTLADSGLHFQPISCEAVGAKMLPIEVNGNGSQTDSGKV